MATAAVWLRAAVTAVELVGDDPAALYTLLDAPAARSARAHRATLRASGTRRSTALAVAVEASRLALLRPVVREPSRGARLLARWMRALAPEARAAAARALTPADAATVRGVAREAVALDAVDTARVGSIVGRVFQQSGCVVSASQWTELLDGAEGLAALVDPVTVRIERLLRLLQRSDELRHLASQVPA